MKWEKLLLLLASLGNVIWVYQFSIVPTFSQDVHKVNVATNSIGHYM
jgi:hypothetical protein